LDQDRRPNPSPFAKGQTGGLGRSASFFFFFDDTSTKEKKKPKKKEG
jgi:hypothetical protein